MSTHNVRAEQVAAAAASPAGSSSGVTLTQTYATADATHANPTGAAVVTTGVTQTTPFGFVGAAQGDAISTTINQIIVDLADLKQFVNSMANALRTADIIT
jgi:sirohydrochlorin ferrochelatase